MSLSAPASEAAKARWANAIWSRRSFLTSGSSDVIAWASNAASISSSLATWIGTRDGSAGTSKPSNAHSHADCIAGNAGDPSGRTWTLASIAAMCDFAVASAGPSNGAMLPMPSYAQPIVKVA